MSARVCGAPHARAVSRQHDIGLGGRALQRVRRAVEPMCITLEEHSA
ncbi:hypothetical protein C7S16_0523 [Burkholderia thailandensis]|uniref:Uncharacterized protein n=1 Tax=Burkholderia thailandensis TaxID=57975 RepID=A0AAW9CUY3_BURTH|nr:hypothetical protein [Burkholderia thailandensis]